MIKETRPVSLNEAQEIVDNLKETEKTKITKEFVKKFCKIKPEKGKNLKQELENLELIKLKNSDIVKIIDLLPEDSAELNKIFTEVTLDAEETAKILDTIKKNK